ncbi:MAG: ribokinase, partial [Rhodospirillaceae bacterium]|nr:ribokinase [Rhodospirillaceae bacterium]
ISVDHRGENQIVVSSGANLATTTGQLQPHQGDLVLQQMEITPAQIWAGIDLAHEHGARTILNAAPFQAIPVSALEKLDTLIVNEVEAEMMAADLGLDHQDLHAACAAIQARFDLTVVLTLGGQGAAAFRQGERFMAGALKITALDTVGAGDAFVGAYVAALSADMSLADCLRWGSVAGGLACLSPGAQDGVPGHEEIAARIGEISLL